MTRADVRRVAAREGARPPWRRRGRGQCRLATRRSSSETTGKRSCPVAHRTSGSRSRTGDSVFNPLTLIEGDWPGPNEVVDRQGDRGQGGLRGRRDDRRAGRGAGREAAGLRASSSSAPGSTIGGATLAGFDLPTAQRLFRKVGQLDEIAVAAKPGVTDAELVGEIQAILPRTAEVQTGSEQAQSDAEDTNEFISFLRTFLLAFGGIALFVGSFVIANSLSITIAQRTREFATLRTIGATNRQILGSVVVEALVVGVDRIDRRALPRPLAGQGPVRAVRRLRLHAAEHGTRVRAAHDRDRARRGHRRHAPRERLPGTARDHGSADRSSA